MKILKSVYYTFFGLIILVAILLVISVFPITGNIKFLVVQSGSMEPAIHTGSIVIIKPADTYKIGEVITFGTFTKTKSPITHRIYDIKVIEGVPSYITKGDANNTPDAGEVLNKDVLGKVVISVPYLGYAVDFAKKPIGFALIIIIPAAIIIFDEVKKVIKEIKNKNAQDKKEN